MGGASRPTAACAPSSNRAPSRATSPTPPSATWTTWRSRPGTPSARARSSHRRGTSTIAARPARPAAAAQHLPVGGDARGAAATAAGRGQVRLDPHRRVDAARPAGVLEGAVAGRRHRAGGAAGRDGRLGVVRAADPPADSRHPRRADATGPRRVRRAPRPAAAGRVRRAGQLLQHRQRPAVGGPDAAGGTEGEPRVGRRAHGGRGGDLQPVPASCCSPTRRCGRAADRAVRPADRRPAARGAPVPRPRPRRRCRAAVQRSDLRDDPAHARPCADAVPRRPSRTNAC